MPKKDPRVDAYIAKAPDFAKPILIYIRKAVHAGAPDVVENIKWGMPSFDRKGILCGMAAFKAHAVFGFWNGGLVTTTAKKDEAMWQFGCITSLKDLPKEKALVSLVQKAVALDEAGVKRSRPTAKAAAPKKTIATPPDLKAALAKNKKAQKAYEGFTEAQRREYAEWVLEAKREETRAKRVATVVAQAAEGKTMGWKYK
jgi:uncharacterized protein YdeI (YjbR/CyaY-like superfamily)